MSDPPLRAATRTFALLDYPDTHSPYVLGTAQEEVWETLRMLALPGVFEGQLQKRHDHYAASTIARISSNATSCLSQALDFNRMALSAQPRTAPLLHYYAMLNLAKACIFMNAPQRLRRNDDYLHGLTDPTRLKRVASYQLSSEVISTRRGVFSSLHYVMSGEELRTRTDLPLGTLLSYCSWIESEQEELGRTPSLMNGDFMVCHDEATEETWIRAYVQRVNLTRCRRRRADFERRAPEFSHLFNRRQSDDPARLAYETDARGGGLLAADAYFRQAIKPMRFYWFPIDLVRDQSAETAYVIPMRRNNIRPLPEACVIFGIMFYLATMVRYQPHIYEHLLGSSESYLLESFVRQYPVVFAHLAADCLWQRRHAFATV